MSKKNFSLNSSRAARGTWPPAVFKEPSPQCCTLSHLPPESGVRVSLAPRGLSTPGGPARLAGGAAATPQDPPGKLCSLSWERLFHYISGHVACWPWVLLPSLCWAGPVDPGRPGGMIDRTFWARHTTFIRGLLSAGCLPPPCPGFTCPGHRPIHTSSPPPCMPVSLYLDTEENNPLLFNNPRGGLVILKREAFQESCRAGDWTSAA